MHEKLVDQKGKESKRDQSKGVCSVSSAAHHQISAYRADTRPCGWGFMPFGVLSLRDNPGREK